MAVATQAPVELQAPVGPQGENRFGDVMTVRQLLSQVPTGQGGPQDLAPWSPRFDADLVAAIRHFQLFQFGWESGQVSPGGDTLARLKRVLDCPTPSLPLPLLDDDRAAIVRIARSQIGRVSDDGAALLQEYGDLGKMREKTLSGETVLPRKNWTTLKGYMDDAMESPPPWGSTVLKKYTTVQNKTVEITPLEGVKYQNMRVPQDMKDTSSGQEKWLGIQWCGVFACWVLRRAGFDVRWVNGTGICNGPRGNKAEPQRPTRGMVFKEVFPGKPRANIKPGDICVIQAAIHHFIIVEPPSADGRFKAVAGNSMNQGILEESDHKVSDVQCTYRVTPD
jgi:hypothetical protein